MPIGWTTCSATRSSPASTTGSSTSTGSCKIWKSSSARGAFISPCSTAPSSPSRISCSPATTCSCRSISTTPRSGTSSSCSATATRAQASTSFPPTSTSISSTTTSPSSRRCGRAAIPGRGASSGGRATASFSSGDLSSILAALPIWKSGFRSSPRPASTGSSRSPAGSSPPTGARRPCGSVRRGARCPSPSTRRSTSGMPSPRCSRACTFLRSGSKRRGDSLPRRRLADREHHGAAALERRGVPGHVDLDLASASAAQPQPALRRRLADLHGHEPGDRHPIDGREEVRQGRAGKLSRVGSAGEPGERRIGVQDAPVADQREPVRRMVDEELERGIRAAHVLEGLPPVGRVADHAEEEPLAAHLHRGGAHLDGKGLPVLPPVAGLEEDPVVLGPLDLPRHFGKRRRIPQVADLDTQELVARISVRADRGPVRIDDPAVPGEDEEDVPRVIEEGGALRIERLAPAPLAHVADDDHVRVDARKRERRAEGLDVERRAVLPPVAHSWTRHLPHTLERARAGRLVDEGELSRVLGRMELPHVHLDDLVLAVAVLGEERVVGGEDPQRLHVVDEDRLRVRREEVAYVDLGSHGRRGHSKTGERPHGGLPRTLRLGLL